MATPTSHNKKSSAVKRILSEARELKEPSAEFTAYPLDDNIFEWHFTLRGPSATEFEEGMYHGRILLPVEYPFRPPDVMILTPNGRWELNKKICLTFTGFHEEMWQPAWGIRTALIGVQAFMSARAEAAVGIGSLDYPTEERERLAKLSCDWRCPVCDKTNSESLPAAATEHGTRTQEHLPDGLTIDPTGGKSSPTQAQEPQASASESSNNKAHLHSLPHTDLNAAIGQDEGENTVSVDEPSSPLVVPRVHTDHDTAEHDAQQAVAQQPSSFGGAAGPTDAMLGQMLHSRLEAAARQPSISSSQVSTPGALTPVHPTDVDERGGMSADNNKGKQREIDVSLLDDGASSSALLGSNHVTTTNVRNNASSTNSGGNGGGSHRQLSSMLQHTPSLRSANSSIASTMPSTIRHRASSAEASAQRLAALDRAIGTVIFLLAALVLRRLLNAWYA